MTHHREPRFFKNEDFEFLTNIALASSAYRASETGEVLAAVAAIDDGDRETWFAAWSAAAARVQGFADATTGVSAADAYLRAATYWGMASAGALGTRDPERFTPSWRAGRDAWAKAAGLMGAETVAIPYENTALPGWLFLPEGDGPHPLVISTNGSDGANVAAWVQGGAAGVERGYAVLVYDGPGQNALLHEQHIGFRPDWEAVVTPIVDWALARPELDDDRLVLAGVSQGGYWAPRAAAFEHRLAALVADPGVVDVGSTWLEKTPKRLRKELEEGDRAGFDRHMEWGTRFSRETRFTMRFRTMPYQLDDLFDVFRAVAGYRLDDETIGRIRCPTFVSDPEHETFWPGQSRRLFDALTAEKTLVPFTAEEGADLHCEPRAPTLRNQRVYDWLDGVLGRGA